MHFLFGRDCLEKKEMYIHLRLIMLRLAGDIILTMPKRKRGNKIVDDISDRLVNALTFQNFCLPLLCLAMYSTRKIAPPFVPPRLPAASHDYLLSLITPSMRPNLMTAQNLGDFPIKKA
jgi:hypothetical protein